MTTISQYKLSYDFKMHSFLRKLGLFVLFAIGYGSLGHAATYYSRANGNWNNTNTWSTTGCGGASAGSIPGASDDVIICSGRTVTGNVNANARTIIVNGILNISDGITLSVNGNVTVSSTGSFNMPGGSGLATLVVYGNYLNQGATDFWKSWVIIAGDLSSPSTSGIQANGNVVVGGNIIGDIDLTGGTGSNQIFALNPNATISITPSSITTTGTISSPPESAALVSLVNTVIYGGASPCGYIINGPANVTSCAAGPANFVISSTTAISPTYQWEENRGTGWITLSNGGFYSNVTSSSLTISNTTGMNGYIYRCKVTDNTSCSKYSYAGTLTVSATSAVGTIGTISGTATQCAGLTGQTYSVAAVTNATTYTWTVPTGWTITGGAGTRTITVTTGSAGQNGNITVRAGNTCSTTSEASLAVTVNPGTPAQPSVITGAATVGAASTSLPYSVTSVTGVTYTWSYSGTGATITGNGSSSITIDFSASATTGTLSVTPSNTCGTGTSRTLAITVNTASNIVLSSSNPAVSAANLLQGTTKQRIYKFATAITTSNATINSVSFTTSGSYLATDVSKFQLWYNSVNSLVSATQIGSDITTSLGSGVHTFTGLSQVTNAGATGYFWITTDIALTATSGNTISVNALTTGNLIYSSGVKSGSAFVGGVQTIQLSVDSDSDGAPDLFDLDDDNDGIPDIVENAPCNTSLTELFPNSNFDAGNTGFSSGYGYVTIVNQTSLHPEGIYAITPNANSGHGAFANCTGHGNMMVVNGSPNPNLIVWSSGTIPVTPYTDYTLTINVTSVHPDNPAKLIFNVNGENIGSEFNATSTNCQWVHAQATWNSGNLTNATFDIVNLNTIESGNDFAIDDISCIYRADCDSDGDGVPDKLDLDSDNDGIHDVVEAAGTDANNDGIIDGFSDVDRDGLSDNVDNINSGGAGEVTSGTPLTSPDTDVDGRVNRIDLDSDADGCLDVVEAGFTDPDADGKLGTAPATVNAKGKVTTGGGYGTPSNVDGAAGYDYIQQGPVISVQPANKNLCLTVSANTTFSVIATGVGTYKWQVSTDAGSNWTDISDGGIYGGSGTASLTLTGASVTNDKYMYRVKLSHIAYTCSPLYSNSVTLRVHATLPSVPGTISGYSISCPAISSNYSVLSDAAVVTYNWTLPTGWVISSGSGTNTIAVTSGTIGQNGDIAVTATNSCGTTTASTLPVSVANPAPSFTVAPTAGVCQLTDVTYTTQSGKTNYVWTVPGTQNVDYSITSGGITLSDNTLTIKWLTTGAKTVTVAYSDGGCAGIAATASTTVYKVPVTGPAYRKPNM